MARLIYAAVYLVCVFSGKASSQAVAPVKVAAVQNKSISRTLEGNGIIEPYPGGDVKISAVSPMRIEEILVHPGDPVQKGQLLIKLQRDQTNDMEVEKAKINMQQAQLDLDRAKKLYEGGVFPHVKLEQAQTGYDLAKADFELQSRALTYAIKNSEIRSSIDGFISSVNGVVGEIADPSQVLMRVVNIEKMIAHIGIEIEDIGMIREGQPAEIRIPNLPDSTVFAGKVTELNKEIDPSTQLIYIWIFLQNPQGILQPGMFAVSSIVVRTDRNALVVPKQAVLKDKKGSYVYIVKDDIAQQVYVQTGIQTDREAQILKGVETGQSVVYEGNYVLEDGMKVRILP